MNKTNSNIKEVHYWLYLYQYAGKKAYVDLIIKNNKSIRNRLSQIYKICVKGVFIGLISDFNRRKESYKNKQLLHKMKWLTLLSIDFLFSLSVLLIPRAVLFPIIKVYADLRFHILKKNHKVKKGKQKHNLFANQSAVSTGNLRLTEDRIAKTNRQIDLSLRKVVMENRKIMKPTITDEEKGLQILAQGR